MLQGKSADLIIRDDIMGAIQTRTIKVSMLLTLFPKQTKRAVNHPKNTIVIKDATKQQIDTLRLKLDMLKKVPLPPIQGWPVEITIYNCIGGICTVNFSTPSTNEWERINRND